MIKNVKCIGLVRGKSSKNNNKPFTNLIFDVTQILIDMDRELKGTVTSQCFVWGSIKDEIIGCDVRCSVDNFGNVRDIEM